MDLKQRMRFWLWFALLMEGGLITILVCVSVFGERELYYYTAENKAVHFTTASAIIGIEAIFLISISYLAYCESESSGGGGRGNNDDDRPRWPGPRGPGGERSVSRQRPLY